MEEKKESRKKQEGTALELDVIKKISHQLGRGLSVDAMGRVLAFVQNAVQEKKLEQLQTMDRNGQARVPGTAQPAAGLF